jgi:hypothetical protein
MNKDKSINPYLTTSLLHCGRFNDENYPSEIDYHFTVPEKIICCLELDWIPFSRMSIIPQGSNRSMKWT